MGGETTYGGQQLEEGHRKNNILIFLMEERKDEGYFDTLGAMMKVLRESIKLKILNGSTDYVARQARRRNQRPILVEFISFLVKLEVLRDTNNQVGSQIRVDKDFLWRQGRLGGV
jgi:hypothetical protein